ncbi:hypothetical protein BRADI_3g17802v3 [Brachypodium distachyon]|uniref:Core Histone H2A/H2B/H3 domain-containing protein n=1 Tax=Brachypodium distachyon TaxID=15368 RepID=A0A0Q3FBH4_BRADI|nr:hypothetical protein BRADI_3g17802v3 [Brachypodium distachyon]
MQQEDQHQQQLQAFWSDRLDEIEHMSDFKTHSLPLARIKKIMKASGENVQMIAGEAHGLLAKACEIFIQELTLRSWLQTRENNRRTLQKNDIAAAVSRNEAFDFLVDIMQDNGAGLPTGTMQTMVPGMGTFEMYCGNQQPVPFAWPQPQQQQSPHNASRFILTKCTLAMDQHSRPQTTPWPCMDQPRQALGRVHLDALGRAGDGVDEDEDNAVAPRGRPAAVSRVVSEGEEDAAVGQGAG